MENIYYLSTVRTQRNIGWMFSIILTYGDLWGEANFEVLGHLVIKK